MAELSPTASLAVGSPRHRQTLSLLQQNRRAPPQRNPHPSPHPTTSSMAAAGPKPSEVYGFVGSISTVIATGLYLVWAYTPEPCLRSLGITYYPTKYWALAAPSLVMVVAVLAVMVYLGLNFLATPPPTSLATIFDEYSREPAAAIARTEEAGETPIEPISDMSIHQINSIMFAQ